MQTQQIIHIIYQRGELKTIDKNSWPYQGVKLTFFPGSHLAPKYFKVVANSKKLVAMTNTHNHFYPITVLDRLRTVPTN